MVIYIHLGYIYFFSSINITKIVTTVRTLIVFKVYSKMKVNNAGFLGKFVSSTYLADDNRLLEINLYYLTLFFVSIHS